MPRNDSRRNPKEDKLAQLAAIAQLYSGLQGPQLRAQDNQQQNMLGMLGLAMQNQQGQARTEIEQQKLRQDQTQFDTAQRTSAQQGSNRLNIEALQAIMADPSYGPAEKSAAMSALSPDLAKAFGAMGEAKIGAVALSPMSPILISS